jgi:hypothetical protein
VRDWPAVCDPQVFEYCETDLELVIKDSSLIFSAADVKSYMQAGCRRWRTQAGTMIRVPGRGLRAPTDMAGLMATAGSTALHLQRKPLSPLPADGAEGADFLPRSLGAAPRH